MASKINEKGLAIFETLNSNKGKILAFAEIASAAHIEPKTGFLTAAKKIALDHGMTLQKVVGGVKAKVKTLTSYPNGLTVEAEKETILDGYRLVDGKDQPKEIKAE